MGLLDLVFPKRCVGCRKSGEYICPNCFSLISFDVKEKCLGCGFRSIDGFTHPGCRGKYIIDGAFCVVKYKKTIQKLIYQFKYEPYLTDLQKVISELFYEGLIQKELFMQLLESNPTLIPIPLSKRKFRKRGYNHAEILAKNLAKKFSLQTVNYLVRIKETKPQFGLGREDRKKNIKGAFDINDSVILARQSASGGKAGIYLDGSRVPTSPKGYDGRGKPGMTAILVDDVLTTGSTLLEAANVLKRNGFEKVYAVVFAQEE